MAVNVEVRMNHDIWEGNMITMSEISTKNIHFLRVFGIQEKE